MCRLGLLLALLRVRPPALVLLTHEPPLLNVGCLLRRLRLARILVRVVVPNPSCRAR
jgi:hypothetical protein